jgi:glycosyltransferase-like protein
VLSVALLTYSTRPRGGVVHTLALAEALAAEGVDVTVWTLGRKGDSGFFRTVDPAVVQRIVPFPEIEGESVGARVARSIDILGAAFQPGASDIVHAQDCITANAAGPCIRTVHHLDHFTTPQLAACHERAIVEPHTHVCVSAAVARELEDGWAISATVIPNGVDAARFASTSAAARLAWRARFGEYILSVGGIEPRKGSLDLLRAWAALSARRPGTRLVIAGGETLFDYRDYRVRWDALAAELGVEPVVLGPVEHDALPSLVAAAGAFAFPSTTEGFGLAAMEALAAGVPVVTRDLPVFREVFGNTVRYGRDAEEMARQLDDALTGGGHSRTAVGQALARRHEWSATARAHVRLYEDVARRRATPASTGGQAIRPR